MSSIKQIDLNTLGASPSMLSNTTDYINKNSSNVNSNSLNSLQYLREDDVMNDNKDNNVESSYDTNLEKALNVFNDDLIDDDDYNLFHNVSIDRFLSMIGVSKSRDKIGRLLSYPSTAAILGLHMNDMVTSFPKARIKAFKNIDSKFGNLIIVEFIDQRSAETFKKEFDNYRCYPESDDKMHVYTFHGQNTINTGTVKQLASNFERVIEEPDRPGVIGSNSNLNVGRVDDLLSLNSLSLNSSHNLGKKETLSSNMLGFGIETRSMNNNVTPVVSDNSGVRFRPKEDINDVYQNMTNAWRQMKNAILSGSVSERQKKFSFIEALQNEINDLAKQTNMEPFCPNCKKSLA